MGSFYVIALFSSLVSFIAIILSILIFNKVLQEDYKKPWLFIGISIIFLAIAKITDFINGLSNFNSYTTDIINFIIQVLEFISITILTYAILLEYLILKYYKGKFIKFKFIPVQEGNLSGNLDIDVSKGNSYVAIKKDKSFLDNQFSQATKNGFEGFLITEENPKEIRQKYKIEKTPIAWISQFQTNFNSDFIKDSLDQNSDIVDPINLNSLITYIDNFLEQSSNPFIMIDLNLILKLNSFPIVFEFLKYVSSKVSKFNGILIITINQDVILASELNEIKTEFKLLE